MRIAITIPSLYECGGSEHFGTGLANYLSDCGHSVSIFAKPLASKNASPILPLDSKIEVFHFRITEPETARNVLLKSNFDVCILIYSSAEVTFWINLLNGTNTPFIYSERSNPKIIEELWWNRKERLAVLAAADWIHLLTEEYSSSLPREFLAKTEIIPNFSRYPLTPAERSSQQKVLLSLGRLNREAKQLPMLIEAFAKIQTQFPDWILEIWGSGEEEKHLKKMIKENRLKERALLKGGTSDADRQFRRAEIFVIPSRFEGMPNSVIEALSFGLPVVGFSQCLGVNALVQHNISGLLAREMSAEALANELQVLMKNEDLRKKLSKGAIQAAEQYRPEAVLPQWGNLITQVASRQNETTLSRLQQFKDVTEEEQKHLLTLWKITANLKEFTPVLRTDPLMWYVHSARDRKRVRWPWKLLQTVQIIRNKLKS